MTRNYTLDSVKYSLGHVRHYLETMEGDVLSAIQNGKKLDNQLYAKLLESLSRVHSVLGDTDFELRQAFVDSNPELFKGQRREIIF